MLPKRLSTLGILVFLLFSFSINAQNDCTDATVIPFVTNCGTEFTLCVDNEITDINTPVVISIFSNDNLGILQMCDVSISAQPSHGTVEVLPGNCQMKYTPEQDYVGMDQFRYQFSFWDVCTEPYCVDGLHIWDLNSYYFGPDNVSMDVFASNKKIASEAVLNDGDIFEVDGTGLSNAENQNWRFVFYDNACLAAEDHCKVITFNEQDRGRIMNNQYQAEGVIISAVNNNSSHPNLAIIFDSNDITGDDPDLGTPNEDFGGPGIGAGGEQGSIGENSESLGNLLIIAENDGGSSGDGTVDNPDDEVAGGVITFTFDEPVTVNSMKIIDLEDNDQDIIRCYNKAGDLISTQTISGAGDNSVLTQEINVDNVGRMEVELQSSGAIDDISFCRPFDCLEKVVVLPTACPAAEGVIGEPQGDMFRPLSGCVAPTGADCSNTLFRMPTEVTTFQTAETDVNILIQPGGALPIEFGSISGRPVGTSNEITWEVLEVVDERYMILEKSDDGTQYSEITKYGDLRSGLYEATDDNVISADTYYRIKSISNNNEITYSRVISVSNENAVKGGVTIFPQPAFGELHFASERNIVSVELRDLSGKLVYTESVDEKYHIINVKGILTGGLYIARVLTEDGDTESKKIIIR